MYQVFANRGITVKNVTIDRMTTNVFVAFVFIFLLLGLQIGKDYITLFIFGLTSFFVLLLALLLKHKSISLNQLWLFTPFLAFQAVYILNYTHALHWIIYQFVFILVCFVSANIVWKKGHVQLFSIVSLIVFPLVLYYTLVDVEALNANTSGGLAFLLAFFPLLYLIGYAKNLKFFRYSFVIIISLSIILMTDTRSIILSVVFMLLTWSVWKIISKNKVLFKLYFGFVALFCYIFTVIYPKLDQYLPNFHKLDYLMIKYTGKSIHSGRDAIWNTLLEYISLKPLFGYGSGALAADFLPVPLSSHNLYLHITLQVGIVGMAFFAIFLYFIWKKFWVNRYDKKVVLCATYFIGILIYQLFEVSLTQNNFTFALIQWLIIGFGLSYCLNKTEKTEGDT